MVKVWHMPIRKCHDESHYSVELLFTNKKEYRLKSYCPGLNLAIPLIGHISSSK
jgi:hypothetical protein